MGADEEVGHDPRSRSARPSVRSPGTGRQHGDLRSPAVEANADPIERAAPASGSAHAAITSAQTASGNESTRTENLLERCARPRPVTGIAGEDIEEDTGADGRDHPPPASSVVPDLLDELIDRLIEGEGPMELVEGERSTRLRPTSARSTTSNSMIVRARIPRASRSTQLL